MKTLRVAVVHLLVVLGFTKCDSQTKPETMKSNNNASSNEIIVDVRTKEEWLQDGHSDCSVNYPLDQFVDKIEELKKYDKVTLVCRSGARAGVAKSKLIGAGFKNKVENLGSWKNIVCSK
ncbi:MAG: Rhodanese domain protein [Bacteroidetes bacterium]|jgi:rhodanese-related sulfurtransferase|nr:Rhodanese domain protein [Bacteroidota bacterium]